MVIACSSVKTDYFSYLPSYLGVDVREVYGLTEAEYRRLSNGNRLARLWLRFVTYVVYPAKVAVVAVAAGREDVMLVSSNTFYAPFVAWVSSRFRRPVLIHWLYDLFPDALEVCGAISAGGIKSRCTGVIQRRINNSCSLVVYLGEFLRLHGERRWGPARNSVAIDIAANLDQFGDVNLRRSHAIVLHYGGQLGRMHDVSSLISCVKGIVKEKPLLKFDFRVSGARRDIFAHGVASVGLVVNGPLPSAEWRRLISDFAIGLVSLSPGGATVCLPSKTYAMMAGGLAIVAICPEWSDLGRLVLENECGIVVNNSPYRTIEELHHGDYLRNCYARRAEDEVAAEFVERVSALVEDDAGLYRMRQNARRASTSKYCAAALGARWRNALEIAQSTR